MPAPDSADVLTDDDLRAIAEKADPNDIDLLTDEEVSRLDAIVNPPTATGPEIAERKFTEAKLVGQPLVPLEGLDIGALIRKASMTADAPLAGKPTLAAFEAEKTDQSAPPQPGFPDALMTLPSYGTRIGADAPALPAREATGFRDFGKMLGAAAESGIAPRGPEEESNPPYAADSSVDDPGLIANRVRAEQNALIGKGQPEYLFTGNVPYVSPKATGMMVRMLPKIVEDQVASLSEFAFHPMQQAARSPMEFGGNIALAVSGLATMRKLGTATVKELAAMEDAIKAASPESVAAYQASVEGKLDQAAMLKEQIRVLGGSEDDLQRVRSVEERIVNLGETARSVRQKVKPRRVKAIPKVEPAPTAPPVEVPVVSDAVASKVHLTDALSATPAGTILLAGAAKDDKDEPLAPRSGSSPLSLKSALFSAALGYGFYRFIRDPAFRQAVLEFTQISKKNPPDLEKVFEKLIIPMLPDVSANGLGRWVTDPIRGMPRWVTAPTVAGAVAGGLVGSGVGRDEIDMKMGAFGAITGGVFGGMVGSAFAKSFKTSLTYPQLYRMWFTEAAGMSDSAFKAKYLTQVSLDGRIQEIKDTAQLVSSFDTPTQAAMHNWLAGNANLNTVPEKARWAAAKTRLIFDELTLDLLSSGLVKPGVLADKLTTNLGTYLPRLFLKYELGERPTNVVQAWLTSQGHGWGVFSSQDYLKGRLVLPDDVLKALGEIKDRPGYLLGKRGVMTATDVEMARYHRFLLSSPENSIPAKLVRQQKRLDKAQKAVIASGGTVQTPPSVVFAKVEGGVSAAEWNGTTYWKMPDNPRYGLLANRYVERAVAEDIMGMHETASGLNEVFRKGLSIFKFNKAVYNPASQIRNMVSNAIFADVLAGVSPWRIDKWSRSGKELATSGKLYQQARRDGTFGGGFTATEIESTLYPDLAQSSGVMQFVGKATNTAFDKLPISPNFYMRWHQSSEAHARLTVYIQGIEKMGMTGPEAAAFARRVIPDYRDVPRWLKVYRNSMFGAPFISFSYKAIPRMLESAVALGNPKQLLRFWKYPLAMAAMNEYSAYTMGHLGTEEGKDAASVAWRMLVRTATMGIGTPNSYDTFRKFMPGHVGAMQVLVPHRDTYDRPRYYDMTYLLPWGDISEGGKGPVGETFGGNWFPRQLEPANPWMQMFTAAMTGKDTFTGKDIVEPGQEPAMAGLAYAARTFGPSVFNPEGYGAQNIRKAFKQGPVVDPNVKDKTDALVSELLAGRTRPIDPQETFAQIGPKFLAEQRVRLANIKRLGRLDIKSPDVLLDKHTIDWIRENHPGKKMSRALDDYENKRDEFVAKFLSPEAGPIPPSPQKLLDAIKKFEERNKK